MAHVRRSTTPKLQDAILIAAFAGWNDASEVATDAVEFLIRRFGARRFASIDPEEFFVFTETRPHVRYDRHGQRVIDWPANEFFHRAGGLNGRDVILLNGTEPQLRWRTFASEIIGLCQELNVRLVVTLGGLLADVPHTRPPRLTGSSTDPELNRKLRRLDLTGSRYEGPTGIVGVLNTTCREADISTASVWGNVPYYLSSSSNPKVTVALLDQVSALFNTPLDLTEWHSTIERFDAQVEQAVAENPEIANYVQQLEQASTIESTDQSPSAQRGELPSGEAIVRELEEFLRQQRPDDEASE